MTKVTTDSGIELEVDSHTIARARARKWQVVVVVVCALAGWALVLGWLVCCAVSGCVGEGEAAGVAGVSHKVHKGHEVCCEEKGWMVENWQAGRYGNEMCEFEETNHEQ